MVGAPLLLSSVTKSEGDASVAPVREMRNAEGEHRVATCSRSRPNSTSPIFERSIDKTVDGYLMPTLGDGLNSIADTVILRLIETQARAQICRQTSWRSLSKNLDRLTPSI